jgi:hypothetical protein
MRKRPLLVFIIAAGACSTASSEVVPEPQRTAPEQSADGREPAPAKPSMAATPVGVVDADVAALRKLRIIDHGGWTTYDPSLDPLKAHAPAMLHCEPPAYRADAFSQELDIETGTCNYTLLQHPARIAVPEGTALKAHFWYYDLSAPEPAEAHVAIFIDHTLAWESHIPIPSTANVIDADFVAPVEIALDTPIRFHLHNHGQNSWVFSSFVALLP